MERREFLAFLGLGAAAAACASCLQGCSVKDQGITSPSGIDFTLDLNAAGNAALKPLGGYLYDSGVIVAHSPGGYIAVSSACTHQGNTIYYDLNSDSFVCPAHGSKFATDGSVINGPATSPLGRYNATLNGSSLHVYS